MAFEIIYALSCWAVANINLEAVRRLHHLFVIPMGFKPVVVTYNHYGCYASRSTRSTMVMNHGERQTVILIRR